ncbi:PAS domain-containing sensor histidine kinase [Poseidonibacter antarcticus]|uniref:PAS domain-containing sensor histidine kinase n=1 Tax=Poseidonibacter antarcticus TaxID=2478538 RepID=UPI001D1889A4|nr:PAS domain-containing sensor histidine kinase [Poseidonibacter antarcticus]
MLLKNSNLAYLKSIPKTIVLIFNSEEKVVETLGKYSKKFPSVNNKQLKDIFPKTSYLEIKKLLENKKKEIIIDWKEYKFEISISKLEKDNLKALFFFDITKYFNIKYSKEQELQAVFDLAANGISILDKRGMFLYANNFFQKMMGYTMEELYKESCISLSSNEYKTSSKRAIKKAIKEGSVVNFRKICISKSGEYMNASMSLSYLEMTDTIVMITSDITDDIKYQEELKKQVELEVSKRTQQYEIMCHQSRLAAMGEMIDSIAHQWRQPLNGLGLMIQGLRHISNEQKIQKEFLLEFEEEMMEKVSYMTHTIDDFSDFFRITKKKEIFDVLSNIKDAIRLIDAQLNINKITVSINVKENEDLNILGFSNEFRQVIMNMLSNSMMAIVDNKIKNGFVKINIESLDNKLKIEIFDNGGGIEEKNLPKIFDPYFTTKEKGSGIGLYMSKMIIEHHMKGSLAVKNYKEGTMFCIYLKK